MQRDEDGLTTAECWELVRSMSVGRLALSISALPAILPVQYYVDGDELAVCLGHFAVAGRSIDDAVVAFAVDNVSATSDGWTVQVQGTARTEKVLGTPTQCGQPTAGQIVHLEPVIITGHRIRLCPLESALNDLI